MRVRAVLCLSLALLCALACIACASGSTPASVPAGYTSKEEHSFLSGLQDHLDFSKYVYPQDSAALFSAKGYQAVGTGDTGKLAGYFEDFAARLDAAGKRTGLSFPENCVSEGDYYLLKTKEGQVLGDSVFGIYDDYTLCFFDCESDTLYLLRANI